jgi:hypothetical protein
MREERSSLFGISREPMIMMKKSDDPRDLLDIQNLRPGMLRRLERKLKLKRVRNKPSTQEEIDEYNKLARSLGVPDWPTNSKSGARGDVPDLDDFDG